MNNQDIVKSNALIEAAYRPGSLSRMRLLLACLMQVKAKEPIPSRKQFIVTANALVELSGDKAVNSYRDLKKATDDLMDMTITIKERPNGEIGAPDTVKINAVSKAQYYENEGKVMVIFTDDILPYISDLKKRFTQYQAKYVMPMKSSYGVRLYELCLQWIGDEREFEVDEFKQLFGLEKKYKNRIDHLKEKVIYPALADINTYSDIRVKFGQRKTGRRVSHFQFMIVKPAPKIKALGIRDWIAKYNLAKPGESWQQATNRLQLEYNRYKKDPSICS